MSRLHAESKRLFAEALAAPAAERAEFLRAATADDPALRAEVASLLRHHEDLALEEASDPGELARWRAVARSLVRAWLAHEEPAPPATPEPPRGDRTSPES